MQPIRKLIRSGVLCAAIVPIGCGRVGYESIETPSGLEEADGASEANEESEAGAPGSTKDAAPGENARADALGVDPLEGDSAVGIEGIESGPISGDDGGPVDLDASPEDSAAPIDAPVSPIDASGQDALADAPVDAQKTMTILCVPAQPCNQSCSSDCTVLCGQGSTCNVTCSGSAQCSIVCSTGSTCTLTAAQSGKVCKAGPGGMGALMKGDQSTCSP